MVASDSDTESPVMSLFPEDTELFDNPSAADVMTPAPSVAQPKANVKDIPATTTRSSLAPPDYTTLLEGIQSINTTQVTKNGQTDMGQGRQLRVRCGIVLFFSSSGYFRYFVCCRIGGDICYFRYIQCELDIYDTYIANV